MASKPVRLGINIDHVATLRQARGGLEPEPVQAALAAEMAGADGITLHLREDRRHIQERYVNLLAQVLQTPMNLEMAVTNEMLDIATRLAPAHCCLVPEKRQELTTEGGLDAAGQLPRVRDACRRLADAGVEVALFIDAEPAQLEAALAAGAPAIEIHTGPLANASGREARESELALLRRFAREASESGLEVHAGHGLDYHNVVPVAKIPEIEELNIGHSVIARAVFRGLAAAVADMKALLLR
jgi:pyridoxine 5-phosphate synthase